MRKRGSARTLGRSRRARPRKSTSARSSSSRGTKKINTETTENTEKSRKPKSPSVSSVLIVRQQLAAALAWHDAHVDLERAVKGLPPDARGRKPHGLPYSPWQLLEHLRLAQRDILDFCRDPKYV